MAGCGTLSESSPQKALLSSVSQVFICVSQSLQDASFTVLRCIEAAAAPHETALVAQLRLIENSAFWDGPPTTGGYASLHGAWAGEVGEQTLGQNAARDNVTVPVRCARRHPSPVSNHAPLKRVPKKGGSRRPLLLRRRIWASSDWSPHAIGRRTHSSRCTR